MLKFSLVSFTKAKKASISFFVSFSVWFFCIKLKLCIDVLDFEDKNYNGRQLPIFLIADIYHSMFVSNF